MEREFTKKELQAMMSFLIETFEFSEEQSAAIDHQIPMTQELFDSILDKCAEIGKDAVEGAVEGAAGGSELMEAFEVVAKLLV